MTFVEERAKIGRTPIWRLDVILDYCQNEFNLSPCTAGQNIKEIVSPGFQPSIIELANGNYVCAYIDGSIDLYCRISTDEGATWGSANAIVGGASNYRNPALLLKANGDILCFFDTDETGAQYDIKVMTSTDGGSTWGSKVVVDGAAGAQSNPSAILKSDNDIICAYTQFSGTADIYLSISTDGGGTWGSKTLVYAPGAWPANISSDPSLTLLGNDNDILCSFTETLSGVNGIATVISADGGGTWGSRVLVYSSGSTEYYSFLQYESATALHCIFVTNEDGDNDLKRCFSSDDGGTWGSPILIYDSGTSDYVPSVFQPSTGGMKVAFTTDTDDVDLLTIFPGDNDPLCYYTYLTCLDPANYLKGSKNYSFVTPPGAHVSENRLSYIKKDGVKISPTAISAGKTQSRRGVATVNLNDDIPHPKANADKMFSIDDQGISFFRNLKARNRNYKGRDFLIYQGYQTSTGPVWSTEPVFRGIFENWKITGTDIKLKARDLLVELLDKKIPTATASDNDLTATLLVGETTEMIVTDASEFDDSGTVKINNEYVDYATKDDATNKLQTISRGRYGSSAAQHEIGDRVKQVVVISDSAWTSGQSTDKCMLDLICHYGGIDPLLLRTVDVGRTLSGGINASATAIPVDSFQDLVHEGFIRINNEIIYVDGLDEPAVDLTLSTVAYRGMYGTTAASHSASDPVELLQITDEVYFAMAGARYRRKLETPKTIQYWVNELSREALIDNWIDEEGKVSFHSWRPPKHTEIVTVITDDANVIDGEVDDNEEQRVTRSEVAYNLFDPTKITSKDPDDFAGFTIRPFTDKESANYYGKIIAAQFWGMWIFRKPEATRLGDRYMITFSDNPALVPLELEQKDGAIRTGSYLNVTIREQMGVDGSPESNVLFYVLEKKYIGDGSKFMVEGLRLNLDRKYPIISAATATHDYDDAVIDQDVYGWIGSTGEWPTGNKNGAANDDGGYMW
jgi:hypothetical protein